MRDVVGKAIEAVLRGSPDNGIDSDIDRNGDGRRLRWAEHRTQRRAAFVRAGVAAIDEHGPGASAEQMAAAADVSRTVLYRYFRDRDDLRQAIADEIVEQAITSVLPHLRVDLESTPRELITSSVGATINWVDEHPNFYAFLRERRMALGAVEMTLADRIAALLQALVVSFGLDGDEAEPGAYGLVGFVESSCAWWLARRGDPERMSRERFTIVVCDAIWRILDGIARANAITVGYDDVLPFATLPIA